MEVVPDYLVAHVVHTEQTPHVRSNCYPLLVCIGRSHLLLEEFWVIGSCTVLGLHFQFRVELLDSLADLLFAFLEVLDLLEEDVGEIVDVPSFLSLADFEEFEVGEREGREG